MTRLDEYKRGISKFTEEVVCYEETKKETGKETMYVLYCDIGKKFHISFWLDKGAIGQYSVDLVELDQYFQALDHEMKHFQGIVFLFLNETPVAYKMKEKRMDEYRLKLHDVREKYKVEKGNCDECPLLDLMKNPLKDQMYL